MGQAMKALVVSVIVMGVLILIGTAVLIGTVVHRATHRAAPTSIAAGRTALSLDQPAGTRIGSVTRQSDTRLALVLTGGGTPDRLLVWDLAAGRIVATLRLSH
ncbi:hypothetical protein [Lichenicoccus sp.]|uniref:hypothetical protein n=1 Tax=Lichenicoccus sp. TaxID=2781899 RepID=UPI003D0A298A